MKQSLLQKKGWNFAFVPAAVFLSPDLAHSDVRLYAYLLWRQGTSDRSWPTVVRISTDLHMSEQAVRLSLRHLIERDWIRRARNYGKSSDTIIFQSQELCRKFDSRSANLLEDRSANLLEDDPLTGERMIRQQVSRLNESQLTRVREPAREEHSRPVRGKTPRTPAPEKHTADPEIMALSKHFVSLTGVPWLEPKTKAGWAAATKLWITPLREMIRVADGQSEKVMAEAIRQMRKDGLTIAAPASIQKVFVSIYGEKHKKESAVRDPFASFNRMVEERDEDHH